MEQNSEDYLLFKRHITVSRETTEKLERYAAMLREWNEKFNLVAPSTVEHIWTRHFLDSAQIYNLIDDKNHIVADMGSGAGFPGMVLAIMGMQNIHLIESIGKKVQFLRTVAVEVAPHATIHHGRVESIHDFKADIVTARAVAPLNDLLCMAATIIKPQGQCFFLKGKNAADELTEAKKYWTFTLNKMPSLSDSSGVILSIGNPRNAGKSKSSRTKKRRSRA